ncbi:MAG: gamma-glutamyltransferase [Deltaproteobacteria bacterium]|nr:gamma-glutamyltransferase [Deltaproteobacteria bacterium]MBW2446297.1 gamma-glutamyltransferase [Deltaproteobacteria bacterium]
MSGPGVVATGHPLVTAAAAETLQSGGNAFDAVVAAGFAAAAAEPSVTSLGGGGFLLTRTTEGRARLFDFFVDTPGRGLDPAALEPHFVPVTLRFPASEQEFNVGLGSVAVPGNLAGYLQVHEELGRLSLRTVIGPAIRLARDGVPLSVKQAYMLKLLEPIFTRTEAAAAIFASKGRMAEEGELLCNPDLADTLETIAEDHGKSFYEGAIAATMVGDMEAGGGLLTRADLAAYRVVEREPLAFEYRGHRILTNPAPSFGGGLLAMSFELLGRIDLGALRWGSADHLLTLASSMQEVDALRARGKRTLDHVSGEELADAETRVRSFLRGTTHVSVSDREGNVASMTTSNGEGSGYVVPGTGVMLNNMMGEDDLHPDGFHASPPGLRVASMMAPSLVLDGDRVVLVAGSGGSKRIRTALLQVISSVLDFGFSVRDAVEAPRLHWDGEAIQLEPGFEDRDALQALGAFGPVNAWPERDVYFGGVHVVVPGFEGAGDPRRGGSAMAMR